MVISTMLTRHNGMRYFHSSDRIWSIRRRGKVQELSHFALKLLLMQIKLIPHPINSSLLHDILVKPVNVGLRKCNCA